MVRVCLFDLPEEQRSARKLLHLPVSQGGGRSTRSKWSQVEELGDHRHTPYTHSIFRVDIWRWSCWLARGLGKILICHVRKSGGGRDVGFGKTWVASGGWFCGDGGRRRGVSVDSREEIGSVNVCGGGDKEMSKRSDREGAFLQIPL